MKFLIALLVPALLVISVCLVRSWQAGDQSRIPAEEYAVYAAMIGDMFADRVKILVIEDRTVSRIGEATEWKRYEERRLKVGFSPIISQETIDDYVAKNAKSHQLTTSLDLKLKYTLIPKERIKQIFKELPSDEFKGQFPNSGGYIALSRAGFNTSGDQALVYIEHICGGLCGSGHYRLLVKKNEEWVVLKKVNAWIA